MERNIDTRSELETSSEAPIVVNRIIREYSEIVGVAVFMLDEISTVDELAQPKRIIAPTKNRNDSTPSEIFVI